MDIQLQDIAKDYIRYRRFMDIERYVARKKLPDTLINTLKKEVNNILEQRQAYEDKVSSIVNSNFRAIKFVNDDSFFIIHHSTKKRGYYQISFFIKGIPTSDIQVQSKRELLKYILQYRDYNLKVYTT